LRGMKGSTIRYRNAFGTVIRVHAVLGPGFLEGIYRRALMVELRNRRLGVEAEREIVIYYEEHEIGRHRLDLLVGRTLVLELKAVESLCSAHYAQVRSYLKATGLKRALLINFSAPHADYRRVTAL
jgi:GxxExxY protein